MDLIYKKKEYGVQFNNSLYPEFFLNPQSVAAGDGG